MARYTITTLPVGRTAWSLYLGGVAFPHLAMIEDMVRVACPGGSSQYERFGSWLHLFDEASAVAIITYVDNLVGPHVDTAGHDAYKFGSLALSLSGDVTDDEGRDS